MSQEKMHTPGPWFEDESGICADGWGVVAQANYPESYWERGGSEMTAAEAGEHAANSRLIAAAPELLAALEEIERIHASDHRATDKLILIKHATTAALSKARTSDPARSEEGEGR